MKVKKLCSLLQKGSCLGGQAIVIEEIFSIIIRREAVVIISYFFRFSFFIVEFLQY